MAKEIHAGRATSTGGIFMDATKVPMDVIQKQIPHVYKTCLHRGIDITKRRWRWRREATPGLAASRSTSTARPRSQACSRRARPRAASTAAIALAVRRCRPRWCMAAAPAERRQRSSRSRAVDLARPEVDAIPEFERSMACGPDVPRQRPLAIRRADELPNGGAQQARSHPGGTNAQRGTCGVRAHRARGCAHDAARRKSAQLRQGAGRGAGERAFRAQSCTARAHPCECRARAHGKSRRALPARLSGHR